jgi:hypothetical protein
MLPWGIISLSFLPFRENIAGYGYSYGLRYEFSGADNVPVAPPLIKYRYRSYIMGGRFSVSAASVRAEALRI